MENFEKVEKIVEKTGVSYEEATQALEESGGDILDAIIALEKQGKTAKRSATYTTGSGGSIVPIPGTERDDSDAAGRRAERGESNFHASMRSLWNAIKSVLDRSVKATFHIERGEKELLSIPVLVLILFVCFAFWFAIPVLIVLLFFGFRYRFQGAEEVKINLNDVCDKAAETADGIKRDFQAGES